jgi:hypothetical protein
VNANAAAGRMPKVQSSNGLVAYLKQRNLQELFTSTALVREGRTWPHEGGGVSGKFSAAVSLPQAVCNIFLPLCPSVLGLLRGCSLVYPPKYFSV